MTPSNRDGVRVKAGKVQRIHVAYDAKGHSTVTERGPWLIHTHDLSAEGWNSFVPSCGACDAMREAREVQATAFRAAAKEARLALGR